MSKHVPVLLGRFLDKVVVRPSGVYVDATFGEGHYSRALLGLGARVIATDIDPNAKLRSKSITSSDFTFHSSRFGELGKIITEPVDGIVFDIGISSNQLDEDRGFSFNDTSLDMRMSPLLPNTIPALTILNTYPEELIAQIIYRYGEEHRSKKIAREICAYRLKHEITTAKQLNEIIGGCLGYKGKNPATKTFQGLRVYVNDEMGELYRGLCAAEGLVKDGGFIAVVSFHSLEDRLVKSFFRFGEGKRMDLVEGDNESDDEFIPSFSKSVGPFSPLAEESNVRSRSGKLRIAFRNASPPNGYSLSELNLWQRDKSRGMRQMMRGSRGLTD